MRLAECDISAAPKDSIEIWDTQYAPRSHAGNVFRRGFCNAFMPWLINQGHAGELEGRIEELTFRGGAIARISLDAAHLTRSAAEIRTSANRCLYAIYPLSGAARVEHGGNHGLLGPGDLLLHDSSLPISVATVDGCRFECLVIMAENAVAGSRKPLSSYVCRNRIIEPLGNTLKYFADNLLTSRPKELIAVFDALIRLFPIAMSCSLKTGVRRDGGIAENMLAAQIRAYILNNHTNSALTPKSAAQALSISVRYLHKILAASGETFNSHVACVRLDRVASSLRTDAAGGPAIASLALAVGFRDLTTFNRTFRHRFGCSPRQYRSQIIRHAPAPSAPKFAILPSASRASIT